MSSKAFFNFSADRFPVTIILLMSLLDFLIFFNAGSIWLLVIYWLIMIIPKGVISAWNHHHQHRHVFKHSWQNRILEFFYALHTGVTTNLWVLHHNYGHHRNFLDQDKDESRWKRKNGTTMGIFEYTMKVALTAYPRGYKVGKSYQKQQRQFVIFGSITLLLLLGLVIYNPLNALFLFILPMIGSLIFTSWATYGHHADLDTQNQFEASHNHSSKLFNFFTGNLGYHTAHHFKPGIHWADLPELHEKIKSKIPDKCYKKSFFEKIFNRERSAA